ncbi:MAG: hypothetical protein R2839_07935 [Thermomicrobiales bacterium]
MISEDISTLYGIYTAQTTVDQIAPTTARTSYYLALGIPRRRRRWRKGRVGHDRLGCAGYLIQGLIEDALKETAVS